MPRVPIKLMTEQPVWEGPIERAAANLVRSNIWRFRGDYDKDDLMQEGYVIFMKTRDRYMQYNREFSAKRFMVYFRAAFWRHMLDQAKHDHRRRLVMPMTGAITEMTEPMVEHEEFEDVESRDLLTLLEAAPDDVRMIAEAVFNSPEPTHLSNREMARIIGKSLRRVPAIRESFRRLLRIR